MIFSPQESVILQRVAEQRALSRSSSIETFTLFLWLRGFTTRELAREFKVSERAILKRIAGVSNRIKKQVPI